MNQDSGEDRRTQEEFKRAGKRSLELLPRHLMRAKRIAMLEHEHPREADPSDLH